MKFSKFLIPILTIALPLSAVAAKRTSFDEMSGYWQGMSINAMPIKGYIDSSGVFRLIGMEGCQADGEFVDDGSKRMFRTTIEFSECSLGGEKMAATTTFERAFECADTLHGVGVIRIDVEFDGSEKTYKLCRTEAPRDA